MTTKISRITACQPLSFTESLLLLASSLAVLFLSLRLILVLLSLLSAINSRTVGFESNLKNNKVQKKRKYMDLMKDIRGNYRYVKFVNLFMRSLRVFSNECSMFLEMVNDIDIDKKQQNYTIKNMINLAIRATYFMFCHRNKTWGSPNCGANF